MLALDKNDTKLLQEIKQQLELVVSLLRVLAAKPLQELILTVISTENKEQIYKLCNGENTLADIARAAKVTAEYVRLTVQEFQKAGLIVVREDGRRQYPTRLIESA